MYYAIGLNGVEADTMTWTEAIEYLWAHPTVIIRRCKCHECQARCLSLILY